MHSFAQRPSVGSRILIAAISSHLLSAVSIALADPVVFDNSAQVFDFGQWWTTDEWIGGKPFLDPRKSPEQQASNQTQMITHRHYYRQTSKSRTVDQLQAGSVLRFMRSESRTYTHHGWGTEPFTVNVPRFYEEGQSVGPWDDMVDWLSVYGDYKSDTKFTQYNLWEGESRYIGFSFTILGNTHYGWLYTSDRSLEALAWGYESTPGVPMPLPVPAAGTLPLLCFAGLVAERRRR